MVLDTGSELSWLRCSAARSGTPSAPSFRPLLSSSYRGIPCSAAACRDHTRDLHSPPFCNPANKLCRVSVSYADGSSADGDLSSDVLRVGQSPPLRALFSCVDSPFSSSGEDAVTAGLLGMNRGSLSFISQMGTRRFSYCISDRDSTGLLLLGGDSAALPFPVPLNYTPLIQISLPLPYFDRVAYSVQLEGIRVGAAVLPIPSPCSSRITPAPGRPWSTPAASSPSSSAPPTPRSRRVPQADQGPPRAAQEPSFVFQGAFDTCFRVPVGRAAPPWSGLPAVALMFRGGAEVAVAGERLLYRAPGSPAAEAQRPSGASPSATLTWSPSRPSSSATTTSRTSGWSTTSIWPDSASPRSAATSRASDSADSSDSEVQAVVGFFSSASRLAGQDRCE
ncbi:unnamed protein product [Spirodela intermedia]|uniref:Peptidase A1 domain-containing protein n=1 Tax=Spirodela intermedia TaxID=51605 RepID=A0A7I8IB77_SPIIN|nr:unnamed protein product [Spirodela intermedia]CAA6655007.1 unnamed protein product [Spirodela intermedia]